MIQQKLILYFVIILVLCNKNMVNNLKRKMANEGNRPQLYTRKVVIILQFGSCINGHNVRYGGLSRYT